MWTLDNATPFAAERGFARDRDGGEVWIACVKGTFLIGPDDSWSVADEQEPVLRVPTYLGEPGRSSLRYEADLILTKPTTDILLHGAAYSPRAEPATQVQVTLSLGAVTKTLQITGDRVWTGARSGRTLTDPAPFVQMPLRYERALGGMAPDKARTETRNPLGIGFASGERPPSAWAVPNVEHSGDSRPQDPAGFGPIARDWSPRRERAGTYDAAWMEQRRPLVPADFDDRFFQSAPDDQQTPRHLVGGELVELTNLTPEGLWRFRLPRIALGATVRIGGRREHHSFKLHTVVLEPDTRRVLMVWHMAFACHYTLYDIKTCHIYLKERRYLGGQPTLAAGASS
jgi:hypothetical protein